MGGEGGGGRGGGVARVRVFFFPPVVKRQNQWSAVDRRLHIKKRSSPLLRLSFNHLWVPSGHCCTLVWSGALVRGGDRPGEQRKKEEKGCVRRRRGKKTRSMFFLMPLKFAVSLTLSLSLHMTHLCLRRGRVYAREAPACLPFVEQKVFFLDEGHFFFF